MFFTKGIKISDLKPLSQGKHLKIKFTDGKSWISANAWRRGYLIDSFKLEDVVDVVYTLEIDTFSGKNSLVLIIEDIKHSK